jgi:outer membrane murein-binding lipoprotein Lpp
MPVASTPVTPEISADRLEVADFIRNLVLELEQLSEDHDLEGVAACLRAAASEARRAKERDRLVKSGLRPSRRAG